MNSDYRLLKNIATFLKQGYLITDILDLCRLIDDNQKINIINDYLNDGDSLEQAIEKLKFDKMFIEYFKFFCFKNNISKAIEGSLKICMSKNNTLKKIKKELTYPVILIVFLKFFSLFVVYGLLPSIKMLFTEFSITQNILTKILFKLFEIIPLIIILLILIVVSLVFISIYAVKKQYFKLIDLLVYKVKFIGKYIQKYYSIKFALYYNELLINGYDSSDIIVILYKQIGDSDVKMLVYEIYLQVLDGKSIEDIISEFIYFEPLFVTYFTFLLNDNSENKSLDDYLNMSIDTIHIKITKFIKFVVPLVYFFVAGFVVLVYVAIIIPMMNVVSNL